MKNKIVGFTISVEVLINKGLNENEIQSLLCNIEEEISNNLKDKFDCEVIGGKGKFIYTDNENNLIK